MLTYDDLLKDHVEMVDALMKPGAEILKTLTPQECELLHMAFALAGEVGELIDALKKPIFYRKVADRENIVEELGDIEFYLAGIRRILSIEPAEALIHNITKLRARYGATYSDEAAIARADKEETQGQE